MEKIQAIPLIGYLLFCLQIIGNYLYLNKKGRLHVSKKPGLRRYISFLFLISFFLLYTAQLFFHARLVAFTLLPGFLGKTLFQSATLSITGVLILLLSIILIHLTLREFSTSLRFGLDPNNLGKLVTTGVFSHSRNPFFLSILLLFLGISLVIPNLFFWGVTALSLIAIHLFILKEERFMKLSYKDDYRVYCEKVRRYF